jgi:hypothetical protein
MLHLVMVLVEYAVLGIFSVVVGFLALANLKRLQKLGIQIPFLVTVCCWILYPIAYVGDIIFNALVGWYMFGEKAQELTFSARIQRYMDNSGQAFVNDPNAAKKWEQAVMWAKFLDAGDPGHITFKNGT